MSIDKRITARLTGLGRGVALAACLVAVGSCNAKVTEGRAGSFLVIEQLNAASGADPNRFRSVLQSDVVTNVEVDIGGGQRAFRPTIFEDIAQVIMRLGFKDPGIPSNPSSPTSANYITVDRYRIVYTRTDGRNTPGVDVPYPIEGAATFSVLDIGSATFTLVRAQAKLEPPLLALRGGGGAIAIATIAEITFYGHDQTGSEVKVVGRISVNFADWGDPG